MTIAENGGWVYARTTPTALLGFFHGKRPDLPAEGKRATVGLQLATRGVCRTGGLRVTRSSSPCACTWFGNTQTSYDCHYLPTQRPRNYSRNKLFLVASVITLYMCFKLLSSLFHSHYAISPD